MMTHGPHVVYLHGSAGDSQQLDLDGDLFVGGVGGKHAPPVVPEIWSHHLGYGFVGCVRDMTVNDDPVDLAAFARKQAAGKMTPIIDVSRRRHCVFLDRWHTMTRTRRSVCNCRRHRAVVSDRHSAVSVVAVSKQRRVLRGMEPVHLRLLGNGLHGDDVRRR